MVYGMDDCAPLDEEDASASAGAGAGGVCSVDGVLVGDGVCRESSALSRALC